jgi:hypothetical protein
MVNFKKWITAIFLVSLDRRIYCLPNKSRNFQQEVPALALTKLFILEEVLMSAYQITAGKIN